MRDAIGGVVNITFIAIFMVVVSGYLAFSVSYNKAFKVKNKIISLLEQNEGYKLGVNDKIEDYMKNIGYNTDIDTSRVRNIDESWTCGQGYCIKYFPDNDSADAGLPKGYYSVVTFVWIDVPIFNKFLPYLSFFQTRGDTMTIINATNE